jgi:hypothetical protein
MEGPKVKIHLEIPSRHGEGNIYIPDVSWNEIKQVVTPGSKGIKPEKYDKLTVIEIGYLDISHKAVMFAGLLNTIIIPRNKIVRMQPYDDGISIFKDDRQKPFIFRWGKNVSMRLINFSGFPEDERMLNGGVLEQLISSL